MVYEEGGGGGGGVPAEVEGGGGGGILEEGGGGGGGGIIDIKSFEPGMVDVLGEGGSTIHLGIDLSLKTLFFDEEEDEWNLGWGGNELESPENFPGSRAVWPPRPPLWPAEGRKPPEVVVSSSPAPESFLDLLDHVLDLDRGSSPSMLTKESEERSCSLLPDRRMVSGVPAEEETALSIKREEVSEPDSVPVLTPGNPCNLYRSGGLSFFGLTPVLESMEGLLDPESKAESFPDKLSSIPEPEVATFPYLEWPDDLLRL